MIVTEAEGRFVTQRQEPKLAVIQTQLPQNAWLHGTKEVPDTSSVLTLSAPDLTPIQVQSASLKQLATKAKQ